MALQSIMKYSRPDYSNPRFQRALLRAQGSNRATDRGKYEQLIGQYAGQEFRRKADMELFGQSLAEHRKRLARKKSAFDQRLGFRRDVMKDAYKGALFRLPIDFLTTREGYLESGRNRQYQATQRAVALNDISRQAEYYAKKPKAERDRWLAAFGDDEEAKEIATRAMSPYLRTNKVGR